MDLTSKKVERRNGFTLKILYNGGWYGFYQLSKTEPANTRGLTPQILQNRWRQGVRDPDKMFRKRRYKKSNSIPDKDWIYEGLDQETIEALESGNNKKLLEL